LPQAQITQHELISKDDNWIKIRLIGTIDDKPFETIWEIEVDGRDVEIEDISGEPTECEEHYENFDAVMTAFCESDEIGKLCSY